MAKGSGTTSPPGGWLATHHNQAVVIAWVLLCCYITPVLTGAWALIGSDWMKQDNIMVEWFAAFLRDADNTLNEFHKVLLPVMTSITVVTFTRRSARQLLALGVFVLLLFLLTLFVSVSFDIKLVADGIAGLQGDLDAASAKQFLGRMRENLISFLMLLLGVGVVNQTTTGTVEETGK